MTLDVHAHNAALEKALNDLARISRQVRAECLSDQDANTFTLAIWLVSELIRSQRHGRAITWRYTTRARPSLCGRTGTTPYGGWK